MPWILQVVLAALSLIPKEQVHSRPYQCHDSLWYSTRLGLFKLFWFRRSQDLVRALMLFCILTVSRVLPYTVRSFAYKFGSRSFNEACFVADIFRISLLQRHEATLQYNQAGFVVRPMVASTCENSHCSETTNAKKVLTKFLRDLDVATAPPRQPRARSLTHATCRVPPHRPQKKL